MFASLVASWLDRWLRQGRVCGTLFRPQRFFILLNHMLWSVSLRFWNICAKKSNLAIYISLITLLRIDNLKKELIDLPMNQGCQTKLRPLPLSDFKCNQLVAYHGLAMLALQMIILFVTTYLCDKTFFTMLQIKTIVRKYLQDGLLHDMRMALTNTKPRLEKLVAHN